MKPRLYEITDDSGFMALVDPAGYHSFVARDWTLDQLVRHFRTEMKSRRLLIWGGRPGGPVACRSAVRSLVGHGFREFTAQIRASTDRLLLMNYESLTMAAQFDDASLPEDHQQGLLVPVTSGTYQCRVVQRFDPGPTGPIPGDTEADFLLELTSVEDGDEESEDVPIIPWTDL